MVSVELRDALEIAQKYANGNLSGFLRILIYQHDKKNQTPIKKNLLQPIAYMLISICLILIGSSAIIDILSIIIPVICILSGIYLLFYIYILKGEKKWIS